jgi:hypothetical protein
MPRDRAPPCDAARPDHLGQLAAQGRSLAFAQDDDHAPAAEHFHHAAPLSG